jgi:M6 family metalloprotease-like protein
MKFALILLLAQDPLLDAEKTRIASKPPLAPEERKAYLAIESAAAPPARVYSLAVVPIEFPDRKLERGDLPKLFFEDVAGWFTRASGGRFELRGRAFDPVRLGVERAKVREEDFRAAAASVEGFDGVAFVVAGGVGKKGTPLWPHKERLEEGGKARDYIVVPERAGARALGIVAHEAMHLLGLEDKYDDEKASVGRWCLLGTGYDPRDPAPPCADCRVKLGWAQAVDLELRKSGAVVLPPDPCVAVRVPVNADGSESLLFEARDRLFIWHVGGGQ